MSHPTTTSSRNDELSMTNTSFKSFGRFALLAAIVVWAATGCIEAGARIDRVQTNLIDKSVFEGEWWFTHTVVELSDEASWAIGSAGAGAPWPGATANFDIASQSGVVGRIRWVVDEGFLYAYRSSEIVLGSSPDARDPDFRGQPLAAYRIVGHFDVRQDFNPVTGEPGNVVSESQDRRWYDRRFVRVDWSQNLIDWGLFGASLEIEQLFGGFRREGIPLGISDTGSCPRTRENPNARCDLPAEWAPQFVRVREERACDDETASARGEGGCYRFLEEWPANQRDTVHYMSFVTQELWTPLQCFGNACNTSVTITLRDAFLRIPPEHEYAVETLANSEYDRFGIIRTESRTYLRGGRDRTTIGRYCEGDGDCDPACADGSVACELRCDTAQHLCVGGLTNELGETDFLTYYRLRHNFYSDSLRGDSTSTEECIADWQCSQRYTPGAVADTERGGSVCDQHARRCTIPMEQRRIRPVRYTLSAHYPQYLVRSAFEIMASWNDSFMRAARESREGLPDHRFGGAPTPPPPVMERVACQSANPVEYCYCNEARTFRSAEVDPTMGDTCIPLQSNYFLRPEARGETNPYQCWIEGPDDVAHPLDFQGDGTSGYTNDVYRYRFVGPECMLVLDVNACDRSPGTACQQLGDLRYQFFNYVSGAGAGWCGVMQPNQDPLTGEAIISPVNQGGICLDNIAQQALNIWPILRGEESADPLFQGEEIREYFEGLGRVRQPLGIAPSAPAGASAAGGPRPALVGDLSRLFAERIEGALPRVAPLHGAEGRALLHSDRLGQIAGTSLEHRLVDGVAAEQYAALASGARDRSAMAVLQGGVGLAPDDLVASRTTGAFASEEMLDRVSPFRDDYTGELMAERERQQLIEQTGTCMMFGTEERAYNLISQYGLYWARAFDGYDPAEARIRWAQAWHRAIMQHEMGHGLGLEHNFAASLDRDHYFPAYFRIEDQTPLPQLDNFDRDRDSRITGEEQAAWLAAFQEARRIRNTAGLGNWTASSTMDYAGDLSDIFSIGFYDRAAIYYNYFNQVEAFDGDPRFESPEDSRHNLLRSDQHTRTLWSWYRGGEQCRVDTQCPFTEGSAGLSPGQPITQRCVTNQRYLRFPIPCEDVSGTEAAEHCVCSNFDTDFVDYVNGAAYRGSRDPLNHYPVQYLFCSNPRLNDISWCNTFDAGETFLEVVSNMRSAWESSYPTAYFRRFRRPFTSGARSLRWIPDAAKIYQHLLFRYFYEPAFRTCGDEPLCMVDQFMASVEAMNFFSYLAQLPDVGSYQYDATTGAYEHIGETMGMPGADFSLDTGQGFYTWSAYQEGLLGFWRMERAGTFFDKQIALRALTLRNWGLNFTIDERYFLNFYDFFPVEMTELFGGYVLDDPSWYAPRVDMTSGTPVLEYLNWYRGGGIFADCRDPTTGQPAPCRDANPVVFPGRPLGGTSSDVLRVYAAIFALAEFPVFYDSSWEQRLAVFKLDSADGFDIPDTQPDGTSTCGLDVGAESVADPAHSVCTSPDDADYILYRSARLHTTYVAVKVRPRITYNLEEEQLGFQLLLAMHQNQERIAALEADTSRTPEEDAELSQRQRRLEDNESFLETLIEVQRIFGITSWL